ncbi:NERD domain-containing protein [Alkalihalobacillus sp. MEB130]|uniref:NERD domain-containing protein n=1 Tax=Alkalihalobacillus sp. MEB130 TaxID=2976704 RepID=UPI0028E036C7|nr:NERD domain-containing protein [Alkalihalobacillus sp. MEB130]MDT8859341.1 NERD domain-containing protein [Alkalihalobacillus sp. MEB130]
MAHLVKLEDYISRYQFDLNRYPSQFTRMKKERWYYIKSEWEQANYDSLTDIEFVDNEKETEQSRFLGMFHKVKNWSKRSQRKQDVEVEIENQNEHLKQMSIEEVKDEFLRDLYHSQLQWASSSLLEESSLHPKYRRDEWLRFFSQKMPDNYFLMYMPVFSVKHAPIQLEILLISPTEIYCISLLEGEEHSVFEASSERFWIEYVNKTRQKRLSPLISLSRMTGVVKGVLEEEGLVFPVRNVVVSKNSMIDNKVQGAKVEFIDRRNFSSWYEKLRKHPSPLKSQQMKVTAALLTHCYTHSFRRQVDENKDIDEMES